MNRILLYLPRPVYQHSRQVCEQIIESSGLRTFEESGTGVCFNLHVPSADRRDRIRLMVEATEKLSDVGQLPAVVAGHLRKYAVELLQAAERIESTFPEGGAA